MQIMKALTLMDGSLSVTNDVARPTCTDGALLIRVLAVGICGTDVTLASGRRAVPSEPWVLGHEAVGEVVEIGPGVSGWSLGDRAVLEPNVVDLTCRQCRRGVTSACLHRGSNGVLNQPGFLQEFVSHPAEFCFRARPDTRIEDLVCTEPMTVAAAAIRRSGISAGDRPLILGAGAQGLFTAMLLAARGFIPSVTDLDSARMHLAEQHGAQPFDATKGVKYTHVFDTTGAPAALPGVLAHLDKGAVVTDIGESSAAMRLSSQDLVQGQLTLIGSFIYDHPGDFRDTLKLIEDGSVEPRVVLQQPTNLEDAAVPLKRSQGTGKPWVRMPAMSSTQSGQEQ